MQINIAAIGLLKKGPELDLVTEYSRRFNGLSRQLGFKGLKVHEFEPSKTLSRAQRLEKEAEQLTGPITNNASIFALDEKGKALGSQAFANLLAEYRDDGTADTWFLIGGADGHGSAVRELVASGKAKPLSFGTATWPHMLVRAMLCEQLYRALTILGHHPYHRE